MKSIQRSQQVENSLSINGCNHFFCHKSAQAVNCHHHLVHSEQCVFKLGTSVPCASAKQQHNSMTAESSIRFPRIYLNWCVVMIQLAHAAFDSHSDYMPVLYRHMLHKGSNSSVSCQIISYKCWLMNCFIDTVHFDVILAACKIILCIASIHLTLSITYHNVVSV